MATLPERVTDAGAQRWGMWAHQELVNSQDAQGEQVLLQQRRAEVSGSRKMGRTKDKHPPFPSRVHT